MSKAEILKHLENLQSNLAEKSTSAASLQSDVDELDMSYNITSIKEALEELESDIDSLSNDIDEVVVMVNEYHDGVENKEHQDEHRRLVRNANDVLQLLGIITQRVTETQARGFEYSGFHYEYTTSDSERKLADGLFRLYWLLIDIAGYSTEQFQDRLTNKEIDYKVKDLGVTDNVATQ